MTIKVYRINDQDWYAAESIEAAKACCLDDSGMTADEAFDDPRECTETEMKENEFYQGEPGDSETTIPFSEQLENMINSKTVFPCLFASSEY